MGFIRKNLQKVIEWKDDSKDIVVYRFNTDDRAEIMTGSTLVVRESQMAIFVYKGKVADVFEPGTYRLTTEVLPFLTQFLSIGTGFDIPIKSEVYFINTKQFVAQKWGTKNPIALRDNEFGMVRLRGYGIYNFRVVDPKAFMKEVFGTNEVYTSQEVSEQIKPMVIQALTDAIAESKMSILDLATHYNELSGEVVKKSEGEFVPYGIKIEKFVVENISLPDEVERALDERSKIGIMSDKMGTYAQYQAATAMRDAANNPSGGGNFVGMGIGLNSAGVMGGMFNNSMQTVQDKPKKTKTCIKCGAEISEKAKHCSECGAIQSKTCAKCGEPISARSKFCPNCGEKVATTVTKKICPDCGEELKSTAKFCPNCGKKC